MTAASSQGHPPVIEGGAETATLGSLVTVADGRDRRSTYLLVEPREADAARGRISVASPVGTALLGRRAGDTVTIRVPAGERSLSVLAVGLGGQPRVGI
ncbi:MAG: GreA/GreB family elongation factor [Dehalococcoidia bacterium]